MKSLLVLLAALSLLTPSAPSQESREWPQWRGPDRDGVWHDSGLLEKLPKALEAKWRVPIGNGYCGPTVADGRVFVMDRVIEPVELERVHCFAWETGESLFTHEYPCSYDGISYPAGPRCSVLVHEGLAYSLGSKGHLFCLEAATGKVVWAHDIAAEFGGIRLPIWGIAASPIIEGDLLIVPACGKAKGSYLVAFDRLTGRERWRALDDRGNYSAPIVIDQAGHRVLVCWSGDRILGVNPKTGALHWEFPFAANRMPLGVASPVLHQDKLFFTGFYDGSLLLQLGQKELTAKELWQRKGPNEIKTDALQSIISTPLLIDDQIYGVDSHGQLRCLSLLNGDRIWEDLTAVPKARWATIHLVRNKDKVWMFNERGELLLGELSKAGFKELGRSALIKPTLPQLNRRGGVCWTHPAFAHGHVFIRNDEELLCADLRKK